MSFVVIFQVVVEYGFMITATAQIAASRTEPDVVGRVVATTMLAKFGLVLVTAVAFACTAFVVPMVRDHLLVVSLFLISAVTTAIIPDFYFRGVERMRSIALRAVGSKILALVLILILVRGDEHLALVPASLAAGNLLASALGFVAIRRDGVRLPSPRIRDALTSLRAGAAFFGSRVAASVNQAAGVFVLGLVYAPASAAMAQFAGASRIASAGELAVIPISDSIYPHMVRTRDYRLFWRVYLGGLALWFLGCFGVFLWAEDICAIILGEPFAPAGELLRILAVGVFIAYSSNLFGYAALTPLGLARHANYALFVGAGVTLCSYSALSIMGVVQPATVCTVVVVSQAAIFLYRFGVFLVHRSRWQG